MTNKYFILDEKQKPKEVSQEEHSDWTKKNSKKYNRVFYRDDGTKDVNLNFQGIKESGKELILFSVRSVFKGYDGGIVTDINHDFTTYNAATEHYEEELFLNGDEE